MANSTPRFNESRSTVSSNALDDIDSLHAATATTDYNAFVGREEPFSSDDSLPPRSKPISRARAKKSRKAQQTLNSSIKASDRPLRPAQDILSRLRHDPALSSQSFAIGYLDRHASDVLEMPLESWKGGDVTDEEFIPQHRILWFKRTEDGVKVWDRKERLDVIFGSGLRSGESADATCVALEGVSKSSSAESAVEGPSIIEKDTKFNDRYC